MDEEKDLEFEGKESEEQVEIASEPETKEQKHADEELQANLDRVQFTAAKVKDIVSSHSGSILAKDGPIVPLAGALLDRAQEVFDALAPPEKDEEVEETDGNGEEDGNVPPVKTEPKQRRVHYDRLARALFDCGVTQVNVDDLLAQSNSDDDEEEGAEHPLRTRINRIISTLISNDPQVGLGPSNTVDNEGFIYFVGKFYAPKYYYGQRMRRSAGRGCISDVLDLLVRGTDVNCGDGEGLSTLHYCAEFNRSNLITEIYEFCRITNGNPDGNESNAALLLNARCKAGWTPLYSAVHHNNIEVVQILLDLKADVNITTIYGKTPLHAAAGQGYHNICQLLMDIGGADPNVQCSSGMTPTHDAAYKENHQVYNYLYNHRLFMSYNNIKVCVYWNICFR